MFCQIGTFLLILSQFSPLLPDMSILDAAGSNQEYESMMMKRRKLNPNGKVQKTALSESFTSTSVSEPLNTVLEGIGVLDGPVLENNQFIPENKFILQGSVHEEVVEMMKTLQPPEVVDSQLSNVQGLLAAVGVLVRVFSKSVGTVCHQHLITLLHNWIPWVRDKVKATHLCLLCDVSYVPGIFT
jgi:hypothetical protein